MTIRGSLFNCVFGSDHGAVTTLPRDENTAKIVTNAVHMAPRSSYELRLIISPKRNSDALCAP
jgi:hypothetical protein